MMTDSAQTSAPMLMRDNALAWKNMTPIEMTPVEQHLDSVVQCVIELKEGQTSTEGKGKAN
jgi:hypothetical protein